MALLAQNLDYSDKDLDSLRVRLQALISAVFPTWTDFNVANFGNILIELYAFVGDTLGFYQDNQAGESRITTATQRKNLLALCKLIGFTPTGATAAQFIVILTLTSGPPTGSVTLAQGTVCKTADITSPVLFELLAPAVFSAGLTPPIVTATVENSQTQSDAFDSTGLANQSYVLSQTPYLDLSAAPVAGDGPYTQVDNFLDSGPGDQNFVVVVDQNSAATIVFGNGVSGKIPVGTIIIGYKTGGGSAGNVQAGAISQIPGFFADSFGNPVQVSVTNPGAASLLGLDQQSNQQIQMFAPQALRALNRTVAREDFEINAQKPPVMGVARALMTTSNEDQGVQENSGILYIIPPGGGQPASALLAQVKNQFISTPTSPATYPSTLTFRLAVQGPNYLVVNVFAVVWFAAGVLPASGGAAIRAALASYFAITLPDGTPNPNVDFGYNMQNALGEPIGTVSLENVLGACKGASGVTRVGGLPTDFTLNGAHADLPIGVTQFPSLGTVTLINGIDGSSV